MRDRDTIDSELRLLAAALRVAAECGGVASMAAQVDRCTVNGEQVIPQPGGLYGGWGGEKESGDDEVGSVHESESLRGGGQVG